MRKSLRSMTDHASNKELLVHLLRAVDEAEPARLAAGLRSGCADDAVFEIFHPFNRLVGLATIEATFWRPLKESFPDFEHRLSLVLAGSYEEREWVSALGHVMGSFERPWLGIPPTHGLVFLRFGINALVRDGAIAKAYLLLDVVDLMRQAGFYPFRRMPGAPEQWPAPPCTATQDVNRHDAELGADTLRIVREMQDGLGEGRDLADHAATSEHSPHWHPNMNWYGPVGIGSSRGQRGFDDYHGALFIQAFPDRASFDRLPGAPEDAPGHYIQIGDGRLAVTGGWPSLSGTHTGGQWLGLPPSGRRVEMRVADWYRCDENGLLIDNWVMIDVPHIAQQIGLDLLDDLRYFADPTLPRWPRH